MDIEVIRGLAGTVIIISVILSTYLNCQVNKGKLVFTREIKHAQIGLWSLNFVLDLLGPWHVLHIAATIAACLGIVLFSYMPVEETSSSSSSHSHQ
ncbi:MAG: hypothetical protein UZ21_OP11001000257 [Microgenomates bacterium OLB22]|nr:MAG: hypothetical protein UZ21_OP11001000257 [Microgenomates bacterium OLB22]